MKHVLTAIMLLLILCAEVQAQEAVRASMAGEQAAAARKQARTDTYYNLDLDPVKLRFSSGMGVEYNDNVDLTDDDPQEDFIIRPQVGFSALWHVSQRNSLDLGLNFGYEYYTQDTRPSRFFVAGDENSGINFDIFVGDFSINLHDRFALTQDPSDDPSATGVADVWRLENTLGTTVTWDLYKVLLDFNYDHYNYVPFDDENKYLKHASDFGSVRVTALVNPSLAAGMEVGGGVTDYNDSQLSDNQHFSIGPFARFKPSDAMTFRGSFGYVIYWYDASSSVTNSMDQTGLYADLSIDHIVTKRTRQTLSIGESLSTDINSTPLRLFYVRYAVSMSIIKHWNFRPYLTYESGTESDGPTAEDFTRYSTGLTATRRITQKLYGAMTYELLLKDSDVDSYSYTQNRLVLNLTYHF